MADEVDVEALLEAPYRKQQEASPTADAVADRSPPPSDQDDEEVDRERKRHKKRHRRSKSRSRSRSHSPRRHRSKERRRRRSNSRDRDRRRRSRERRRSRSRSYERRRSRSRDRRRSSRERRRRSSRSRSRDKRRRSRSSSRDRKQKRSRSPERKQSTSGAAGNGMPLLPPPAPRVHEAEPPPEDRDKRTVMCMQLSARVGPKQLEEFFQQIGQVRDVQMISDRNSRRSKGIAYVEFYSQETVPLAMAMTGQKLFGVPIIVQPTMAEKNRLAAAAQNLKKAEGPKKLYVGSLHYNINESMLKGIFEPFGQVEKVTIMKDTDTNMSKGFGFVEFVDSDSAERAMANLNGFEIAGRPIKVNHVTEREVMSIDSLEVDESDVGMGMTPQSRAALMAKLAEGHNAGLSVPQIQMPSVPIVSCCVMISNMFDASAESGSGWDQEIKDDVIEEINTKCGNVMHLFVDKFSAGNVYIKCQTPQVAAGAVGAFNGRYYGGNKIIAQLVPENTYHLKFPVAAAATIPLRPLP